MQVVVDNLVTNYELTGQGPVILFLHGWGDNLKTFKPILASLKDYRLLLLDLPGFGQTNPPKTTWGLDDYASFVGNFTKKLGIQPTVIIGHSNGGAIALRGLANGSLSTTKLVLLASAGIRGEYKAKQKALRLGAKTAKLFTAPLPKSVKKKLKTKAYSAIGSDLFVAEHLQDTFKRVVTDDVRADAEKVQAPTLLVYGDKDEATPPRYGEMLASRLPSSRLEVLPGAGHFVHQDASSQTATILQEFLNG